MMLIGKIQDVKVDANGDVTLPCESVSSVPSLFLLMGGYWFEMQAQDFLIEIGGECFLCLLPN